MTPDAPWRRTLGDRLGILACGLGILCLGAVLCFHFPALLTTPQLREVYDVAVLRWVLRVSLVLSLLLGCVSVALSRQRAEGRVGLALALVAVALGGSRVAVDGPIEAKSFVGLDWLILDFLAVSLLFVPLERLFVRLPQQRVFRPGWLTDLAHYAASHLLIGVTLYLITAPAIVLSRYIAPEPLHHAVVQLPLLVQFALALVVGDLGQYAVHRLFHAVPFLWRFHAIHHSSRSMDWLAGSRLHLVDIVVTRGLTLVPLSVVGFSEAAIQAYAVFVALQAVFIHSNTSFELRWLRRWLATPAYHHWHHSDDPQARDTNFAVSLPVIDRLFGTYHFPAGRWPESYGIEGDPVPADYVGQVVYPFVGSRR